MSQKNDIFVSYSRHDAKVVDEFVDRLEREGYIVWIDRDGIESGDAFKKIILQAIKNSSVILFFSSQFSNKSIWTAKEIGVAVKYQKPIIPILLDGSNFNEEVEFDLINLDFVDYQDVSTRGLMMEKLVKSMKAKIPDPIGKMKAEEARQKYEAAERERLEQEREKTEAQQETNEVAERKARREETARKAREAAEQEHIDNEQQKLVSKPKSKKRTWLWILGSVLLAVTIALIIIITNVSKVRSNERKYNRMGSEYDEIAQARPEADILIDPYYNTYNYYGCRWIISEKGYCGMARTSNGKGPERRKAFEPCVHEYIGHDGGYNTHTCSNCEISDQRYLVEDGGWMGFVDGDFNWIVPQEYPVTDPEHLYGAETYDDYYEKPIKVFFASGLQPIRESETGKWGYVSHDGSLIGSFEYDDAYPFYYNVARVQIGGQWDYIKPSGEFFRIQYVTEELAHLLDPAVVILDDERFIPCDYSMHLIEAEDFKYDEQLRKGVVNMHVMSSSGYDFWVLVDNEGYARLCK